MLSTIISLILCQNSSSLKIQVRDLASISDLRISGQGSGDLLLIELNTQIRKLILNAPFNTMSLLRFSSSIMTWDELFDSAKSAGGDCFLLSYKLWLNLKACKITSYIIGAYENNSEIPWHTAVIVPFQHPTAQESGFVFLDPGLHLPLWAVVQGCCQCTSVHQSGPLLCFCHP